MKVAVYGSLRKGLGNSALLNGAKYLGDDVTAPEYTMVSLGFFPGIIKGGETSVVVEVYEINEEKLRSLDMLEGYHGEDTHNFYNREVITLPKFGEAYIYTLPSDYGDHTVVENGDWKDYLFKKEKVYE